jgi:hypothetical protein
MKKAAARHGGLFHVRSGGARSCGGPLHLRRIMRLGTCLLLAVMSGVLGLSLRLTLPSQGAPIGSNTPETSPP